MTPPLTDAARLAEEAKRLADEFGHAKLLNNEFDNESAVRRHRAALHTAINCLAALATSQPAGAGWQPISCAPKDGTEILAWREDCGVILIRWTSPEAFLSDREIAEGCEHSGDDEWVFQQDWFCADFVAGSRLERSEVPTHWMPLPVIPARTQQENCQ